MSEIILPPEPPPSFDQLSVDLDANASPIKIAGVHIECENSSGPFFAKNYRAPPQYFTEKQSLVVTERPGCKAYYGDSTMSVTGGESIFERYSVPFTLSFFDCSQCALCKSTLQFVNCAMVACKRYGFFSNDLTGWNETKCQYYCEKCNQYVVFVERQFVFILTGYYELAAKPCDTKSLVTDVDCKWRRATPDYWMGVRGKGERDRITWDSTCFCCKNYTEQLKDGAEGHVSGSGRSSSLYGVTFCRKCDLCYSAAEHD